MTGFELWTSLIGSDRSTNWATALSLFIITLSRLPVTLPLRCLGLGRPKWNRYLLLLYLYVTMFDYPRLLFRLFLIFQTNITIIVKMSFQYLVLGLNPLPLKRESPPWTTRPGLKLYNFRMFETMVPLSNWILDFSNCKYNFLSFFTLMLSFIGRITLAGGVLFCF